eukprot:2158416-Amphidinium_carterae.1
MPVGTRILLFVEAWLAGPNGTRASETGNITLCRTQGLLTLPGLAYLFMPTQLCSITGPAL